MTVRKAVARLVRALIFDEIGTGSIHCHPSAIVRWKSIGAQAGDSVRLGLVLGKKSGDGTLMRWHCIVRGNSCTRDIPGQGTHGWVCCETRPTADDVLGE